MQGLSPQPLNFGTNGEEPVEPVEIRFTSGRLDLFVFGPDLSLTHCPLREDDLEVSVMATGISFEYVLMVFNRVNEAYIGQEFAGQVTLVGSALMAFSPGDRVCGIAKGSFRSLLRAPGVCTMNISRYCGKQADAVSDGVLDSLIGRYLAESWRCLAPLGRSIEIGKRDISSFADFPWSHSGAVSPSAQSTSG
ncbi:hypothetical protein F4775DRAFT_607227 [Biscogniauxia sp. FL1348]|nr:hypothetical protein F4775DRAFT_607227 [Biscogniauxia sp. FL1348]